MWEELGISSGTAIIILIALYYIIKWAVKNGIKDALEKISDDKEYVNYIKKIKQKTNQKNESKETKWQHSIITLYNKEKTIKKMFRKYIKQ